VDSGGFTVRLGLFSSLSFFLIASFLLFATEFQEKERRERRKGLGRIKIGFNFFFKNLIYYLENNFKGLQLFYFMFTST
jgi:hypothetical protein